MCGSLLAPKAPQMAAPMAAAPRVTENVNAIDAEEQLAVENPEPQFQAGSEIDEMDAMEATKGTKRLQTHSKTDTGLAIPL